MSKKSKKNKSVLSKIIKILIIVIIIAVFVFGCYYVYDNYIKEKPEPKQEVKIVREISKYGYSLNDRHTKVYKKYFSELEKILLEEQINYEEYAKVCAKLFIIDFYTLDNKESKNDIGGLEFIKPSMKDNFIDQARGTFYRYVQVKSDKRNQVLPIVKDITSATIEKTTFSYLDGTTSEDAYKVTIAWDYTSNLGYEKEAKMILVKDENKLYIVEMN